jgi:hypothetical protein
MKRADVWYGAPGVAGVLGLGAARSMEALVESNRSMQESLDSTHR